MPTVKYQPNKVTAHEMPEGHVAVILPPKAAQMLADMLAQVGGSGRFSRRKWAAQLSDALRVRGYHWTNMNCHGRTKYDADMDSTRREYGFTFLDNPEGV